MCNFRVGQKVVFVDAYSGEPVYRAEFFGDALPVQGEVYTVRGIVPGDDDGLVYLRLLEIQNSVCPFRGAEASFNAARFRPLVARKTDISIFKAMLKPSKQEVLA